MEPVSATCTDGSSASNHEVLDIAAAVRKDVTMVSSPVIPEQLEQPQQESPDDPEDLSAVCGFPGTSSESELEYSDDDDADVQEFCANCLRRPEGAILRRCTRCLLSHYCSVKCQRENWADHKVAGMRK